MKCAGSNSARLAVAYWAFIGGLPGHYWVVPRGPRRPFLGLGTPRSLTTRIEGRWRCPFVGALERAKPFRRTVSAREVVKAEDWRGRLAARSSIAVSRSDRKEEEDSFLRVVFRTTRLAGRNQLGSQKERASCSPIDDFLSPHNDGGTLIRSTRSRHGNSSVVNGDLLSLGCRPAGRPPFRPTERFFTGPLGASYAWANVPLRHTSLWVSLTLFIVRETLRYNESGVITVFHSTL